MSKCAVHMQKMKSSAVGGIQSHNQREHESRKNKEIDYKKSVCNFDVVNDEIINYQRAVKGRIDELNLKKAVRKDAVTYCSFIVSSDNDFFKSLGYNEHIRRENKKESVAIGLNEPAPFEYLGEDYQADCIREGSQAFFESATFFFQERYGKENVINATVHFDEYTPHMHLGLVPVTSDGRLSAKDIFNPLELKQLQTDFAKKVGSKFDLERGKEGSEAKHLDELSFKVKKRQEALEQLDGQVWQLRSQKDILQTDCKELQKQSESLSDTVQSLKAEISTLDTEKRKLEAILNKLKAYKRKFEETLKDLLEKLPSKGQLSLESVNAEISKNKALEYIKATGQQERFEKFSNELPMDSERINKKDHSKNER